MRVLPALIPLLVVYSEAVFSAELRFGVHNFPPYFVLNSPDDCSGEAVELTRRILESETVKVTAVCATPARLYKMLELGEVDATINIKHTKALPQNVSFVAPPYAQLSLVLLTHGAAVAREKRLTVAAIRGFDYHGQRQLLEEKGYSFIDLPDSISAVELFVKGRSSALLTYEAPFNYYLQQHKLPFEKHYKRQVLEHIDAFYVVSKQSVHKAYIQQKLSQYAAKEQLSYFAH
ncbi:transporter substrate-binding domain-containing protein [Rheinheimera baltica]|uniref:Transporter substrate-binding domain-containing protein n=1 Tax=Rheinheimera baltica TaxID=67576 RepID=A0ABT9I3G6_9GAMM|nr:transporter substrate-binding domain-containing protein [Rheinheimera baltica]MDP5137909.1 transporter substrate-binding domain-containing protein [Rheinheimera baltica]